METSTSKLSQQNEPKAVEDTTAEVCENVKEGFSAITYASGHVEKLPIGLLSPLMDTVEAASVVRYIGQYQGTNDADNLYLALRAFGVLRGWSSSQMILEVAMLSDDFLEHLDNCSLDECLHAAMYNLLCFVQAGEPNNNYDRYFILNIFRAIIAHVQIVASQQAQQSEANTDSDPQ